MKNITEIVTAGDNIWIPEGIEGSDGLHANRTGKIRKTIERGDKTILVVALEACGNRPAQDLILIS